ncbi:Uncharacterised protein [Mycobacteroides abscessus subsp. abscessus]|nr:Uncharacterised protein [Mycobacteroides abscessus subsp. abscessus]
MVERVPHPCTAGCRARRRALGTAASSGWDRAVFVRIRPACSRGWAAAQPWEISPPQSWATVTTPCSPACSSSPRAAVKSPRSATRSARVRLSPVRSEKPISSWSTATTRHGWAKSAPARTRRRHR